MTPREMRSQIEERSKAIENRFAGIYGTKEIGGWTCFVRDDGSVFILDYLLPYGALVVGYADNETEAKLNRFEDGDLFYLDSMDEDTMFQAMLREVKQ